MADDFLDLADFLLIAEAAAAQSGGQSSTLHIPAVTQLVDLHSARPATKRRPELRWPAASWMPNHSASPLRGSVNLRAGIPLPPTPCRCAQRRLLVTIQSLKVGTDGTGGNFNGRFQG